MRQKTAEQRLRIINERLKALGIADYPVPEDPDTCRMPERRALLQQMANNVRAQA